MSVFWIVLPLILNVPIVVLGFWFGITYPAGNQERLYRFMKKYKGTWIGGAVAADWWVSILKTYHSE